MSAFSASREDILASLTRYTTILQGRRDALVRLSNSTAEMRSSLQVDKEPDISKLLRRRERDCRSFAALCGNGTDDDPTVISAAQKVAGAANDEIGRLARSALSLQADIQALGQEILSCQSECEEMMRARLESVAQAIRESAQRRRLDAAYGPACNHESPVFLDKQR